MTDLLDELRAHIASSSVDSEMLSRQRAQLIEHPVQDVPATADGHGRFDADFQWDAAHVGSSSRPLARAVAAVIALIVVIAGYFIFSGGNQVQVASESFTEEATAIAVDVGAVELLAVPPAPVFGFDRPVVLVDLETGDGARCLQLLTETGALRSFFGTSGVAATQVFEPASSTFDTTVHIEIGGMANTCGSDGTTWSSFLSSFARYGSPSDFPAAVFNSSGGSSSDTQRYFFDVSGTVDETVSEVVVTSPDPIEQSYTMNGDRFRVDAVFDGEVGSEEVIVEIRYVDGSTELRPALERYETFLCDPQSSCVNDWYRLAIGDATRAGADTQAQLLGDYELTQDEYNTASSLFLDCLPTGFLGAVTRGSSEAATAVECYQEHLEFVDQARVLVNQMWIAVPENLEEFLADSFDSDWPELTPSPTSLEAADSATETTADSEVDASEFRFTSAETSPSELIVIDARDNVVLVSAAGGSTLFELQGSGFETAGGEGTVPRFIESVSIAASGDVLVGLCCEPAAGTTLRVSSEGNIERLLLDGSFPTVDEATGLLALTDGFALRTVPYDDVLAGAYQSTSLFEGLSGQLPPSTWTGMGTVVLPSEGRLLLVDLEGEVLAESPTDAISVTFDDRNGVVLALRSDGGTVDVLAPESLQLLTSFQLSEEATSIETTEGWILFTTTTGMVFTAPLEDPSASVLQVDEGATDATWVR